MFVRHALGCVIYGMRVTGRVCVCVCAFVYVRCVCACVYACV